MFLVNCRHAYAANQQKYVARCGKIPQKRKNSKKHNMVDFVKIYYFRAGELSDRTVTFHLSSLSPPSLALAAQS